MTMTLRLEQFNYHLEMLSKRIDVGYIFTGFNPDRDYVAVNVETEIEKFNLAGTDDKPPALVLLEEIRKLGCVFYITEPSEVNVVTHPFLVPVPIVEINRIGLDAITQLAVYYPEFARILPKDPNGDSGKNIHPGVWTHSQELAYHLGDIDPTLSFTQAKRIVTVLESLGVTECRYDV